MILVCLPFFSIALQSVYWWNRNAFNRQSYVFCVNRYVQSSMVDQLNRWKYWSDSRKATSDIHICGNTWRRPFQFRHWLQLRYLQHPFTTDRLYISFPLRSVSASTISHTIIRIWNLLYDYILVFEIFMSHLKWH